MNKELILKSDVLDIVFENRNKAYGAYDLRKFYSNRLVKSLGLMICGIVVLSAFTFLPKKKTIKPKEEIITIMGSVAPDKKEEPKKEPEKPKEPVKPQAKAPTQAFTDKPVVVPDKIEIPKLNALTDSIAISDVTSTGKPGILPIVNPTPPTTPGDGPVTPAVPVIAKLPASTPRESAEQMPSFPGGMDALRRFLQRNLQNPKEMEEGESVSVKIKFVVGYDGKLQGFTTIEDGGEAFNKEVIRVLKKMPDWVPGRTNGENVSVYYNIPVKFIPAE
jgi:protein TonB